MLKYVQSSQVANVIGDAVAKWKRAQLKIEWSLVRASLEELGCVLEQGQCSMFSTSSIDMTERKVLTQTKIITKAWGSVWIGLATPRSELYSLLIVIQRQVKSH